MASCSDSAASASRGDERGNIPNAATGLTLDTAVSVMSVADEYSWLSAHPCACGGTLEMTQQALVPAPGSPAHIFTDKIFVTCNRCGSETQRYFAVDTTSEAYKKELTESMRELGIDAAELER